MAYDGKRLKTFKWLEKLAENKAAYSKTCYNSNPHILTCYGRLYATNGIILAEIEYPEFEHISDYGFMRVESYTDDKGYLLETPKLAEPVRNYRDDMFRDMFNQELNHEQPFKADPVVMADVLYPFKVYGIPAYQYLMGDRCMFTGHNKDVSMRVLMMGMR